MHEENVGNRRGRWAGPLSLLGIALIVSGLVVWQVRVTYEHWLWAFWGGGALLLGLSLWLGSDSLLRWLGLRGTAAGTHATVMSVLILGIVIIMNIMVKKEEFAWRIDLSKNKRFTLSDQTRKILSGLKDKVTIQAFYPVGAHRSEEVKDLLHEYDVASPLVDVQIIDPKVKIAEAKDAMTQHGIRYFPISVVIIGGKGEKVSGAEEQDFSSAILKLTSPEVKKVYFATGHQERDPNKFEDLGYNTVSKELQSLNREVSIVDLQQAPNIPPDCACLIIAAPAQDYEAPALEAIDQYLRSQGKLLLLLDPMQGPALAKSMEKWGARIGNDAVIDMASNYLFDSRYPYVSTFEPAHEITRESQPAYFPLVRSVEPETPAEPNMRAYSIVKTSKASWSESDLSSKRAPRYDEGQDVRGPVSIAVASEEERSGEGPDSTPGFGKPPTSEGKGLRTRILVVGDSDFAANQFTKENVYHADLFVNMVNWLLQEEELIAIAPKEKDVARITISPFQLRLVFWGCVVVIPIGLLSMGGLAWWRRR